MHCGRRSRGYGRFGSRNFDGDGGATGSPQFASADGPATGIVIDVKLRNDLWRRLGALVGVFVAAHLLRMSDRAWCPIARLGGVGVAGILRQSKSGSGRVTTRATFRLNIVVSMSVRDGPE